MRGPCRRPREAKAFYGTIVLGMLAGVAVHFIDIDPMSALLWNAVINGIVAVPLMVIMMLMARRRDVMGAFTLPWPLWSLGWISTVAMTFAVMMMFASWIIVPT